MRNMVVGCGIGCDRSDVVERCSYARCGAMLCKMWCDARCGGAMHNVANIWCDLKCGVHGMWHYVERNVKSDAMRDVA